VDGAPVVSIPIAVCLFFMMYPIMVKIDFASVIKAGRSTKPVLLTLFINWGIKPFTMYAIALLFLGVLFRGFIGVEATDLVKLPFGLGYGLARALKLSYDNAAPAAMIGASNHFEVAIATAVMLFGLSSGAALATVVGVLIEVPVMLMLVEFCKRTTHWFPQASVA
jgi:ACR3 family arsenite efflux pump ArsB